jgi:GDP-L-fucose synthase
MGFWKGRRVIVTGGSGFLGSHLVDALRERGCDPFVPRSEDYDLRGLKETRDAFHDARTHFWAGVPGGIREPAIDFVFHLAATCGGIGLNRKQPATMWRDNLYMGLNMVEVAKESYLGVGKFVAVGTVCSYPKHCPVPFSEKSFWDGYPEETNAPYGIAKKALLVGLQAYQQQHGLGYVYVTPTNLYGPRDHFDPEDSHVIPALIRKFLEARESGHKDVTVWGTGKPTRDFLYVTDAVEAILKAAELLLGGPYNVGSGREVSIAELNTLVAKATGCKGHIGYDISKPDGQPRRCLDSSKFMKLTGWKPEIGLEAGLARTVAWYETQRREAKAMAEGLPAEPGEAPSV